MKTKRTSILTLIFSLLLFGNVDAGGFAWMDHRAPFDFVFENHIDTHQQTMILPTGDLLGYLYIEYTGEFTDNGYPVAKHTDCTDPLAECSVGWQWHGVPGSATFIYHEVGDHPLWLVDRAQIPQPGAYSHFHWLGDPETAMELEENKSYTGYFLELRAKDMFAFEHGNDIIIVNPGLDLATHLNIVTVFPGASDGGDDGGHH